SDLGHCRLSEQLPTGRPRVSLDLFQARMAGDGSDLMWRAFRFRHSPRARLAQPMERAMRQTGRAALRLEPFPEILRGKGRAGRRCKEGKMTARCRIDDVAQFSLHLDVNLDTSRLCGFLSHPRQYSLPDMLWPHGDHILLGLPGMESKCQGEARLRANG